MPELIEAEQYRTALAPLIGQRVVDVDVPDPTVLRPAGVGPHALDTVIGTALHGTRRTGKVVLLDLGTPTREVTVGLRFGMTGRLLVDGRGPIERLVYSSDRNDAAWDRIRFTIGAAVVSLRDPRRLGSVELEPDLAGLGVDATAVDVRALSDAFSRRRAPVKSVLLNQAVVAGLGNLLIDETLWRAGISPERPVDELVEAELEDLVRAIHETLEILGDRGGSHTGDTFDERRDGGVCPIDGTPMRRSTVGGRTSWWCPTHQL